MPASLGDGWLRGVFNEDVTVELGLQIGKIASERYGGPVAVACDTRPSGEVLKSAVKAGIMALGQDVIDMGQLPTSALQYYVKTHPEVAGGIMVTASHSPMDYNGFKFISGTGRDDPLLDGMTVDSIMDTVIPQVAWSDIGEIRGVDGEMEQYIDGIIENVDHEIISSKGLNVCVECSRGACTNAVTMLLSKLNVGYVIVDGSAYGELTGKDSELTKENLKELGYITQRTGCDLGVAFDTDADRCLFVTGTGKFVTGDKSMCILARTALERKKGKVVTSVATPSTVIDFVASCGGMVMRAPVGAPIIVRKVVEYEAVFGGEINGGYVFPDFQFCRDAILALARMLESVCVHGPLDKQVKKIPDVNFETRAVPCPAEKRDAIYQQIKEAYNDTAPDVTDGFRFNEEDGWYLIRPSDTGHFFRIYAEYKDADKAVEKADELVAYLEKIIGA